jgi:hypothetical protein
MTSPDTSPKPDPWRLNEDVRRRRLREDAARPLSVNLAETIALSEFFSKFAGSAEHLLEMKRASERPRDRDDLEALEAAQEGRNQFG